MTGSLIRLDGMQLACIFRLPERFFFFFLSDPTICLQLQLPASRSVFYQDFDEDKKTKKNNKNKVNCVFFPPVLIYTLAEGFYKLCAIGVDHSKTLFTAILFGRLTPLCSPCC